MNDKRIAEYYADEHVIRIVAAEVFALTVLTLILHWRLPDLLAWKISLLLLTADFSLRGFTHWPSPLAALAHFIARLIKLKSKLIFAAPKKFAAGLGFIFSFFLAVFLFAKLIVVAYIIGGILLLFALLEATFSVCVGCYIFNWFFIPDNEKEDKFI